MGFMEMRKSAKAMSPEAIEKLLLEADYGVLATVGEDGYPYEIPMNFVYDADKQVIYLHGTTANGHRAKNVEFCDKVCFSVVDKVSIMADTFNTKFESVICFGKISVLTENKQGPFEEFIKKYSPEYMEAGLKYIASAGDQANVYVIKIEHKTGKAKY